MTWRQVFTLTAIAVAVVVVTEQPGWVLTAVGATAMVVAAAAIRQE